MRLLTVAIDPGHGGEDPGAIGGAGTYEKHVALDIAKKLRAKIDAQPNMRAMMTRDADFFVPLNVRVQKARRVGADLFVSIHADAFTTPDAKRFVGVRAVRSRRLERRGALDGEQGELVGSDRRDQHQVRRTPP